jgi:hypothetical protein
MSAGSSDIRTELLLTYAETMPVASSTRFVPATSSFMAHLDVVEFEKNKWVIHDGWVYYAAVL